jgi:hypothetical protein
MAIRGLATRHAGPPRLLQHSGPTLLGVFPTLSRPGVSSTTSASSRVFRTPTGSTPRVGAPSWSGSAMVVSGCGDSSTRPGGDSTRFLPRGAPTRAARGPWVSAHRSSRGPAAELQGCSHSRSACAARRKPRNTAEPSEVAAVPAGVCTARDEGTDAPRTGIMWGSPSRTSVRAAVHQTPSSAKSGARVPRVDCARSAGAAAQR